MAMLMHRQAMLQPSFTRPVRLLQKPLVQQRLFSRTLTRSHAVLVTPIAAAAARTGLKRLPWKPTAPRIPLLSHQWHPRLMSSATQKIIPSRKNKVDVQMLHPKLHDSVFPRNQSAGSAATESEPLPEMVQISIEHLKAQGLWGKEPILVQDTHFPVPPLRGQTIEDHFYNIGLAETSVYKQIATDFAQQFAHQPPSTWLMQPGWTRYDKDGSTRPVAYPEEKALTFDVETVPALSKFPVMACAMSSEAWYGWVSPWLVQPTLSNGQPNDHHLLTFGPSLDQGTEKILVGHNVGYDRARVLEEYSMQLNRLRYLDTMSLHIAVSGLCTQQRPSWLKYSKAVESADEAYLERFKTTTGKYYDVSAVNSLLEVAKFHCGIHMDKAPRNILVEAQEIGTIQEHFQELMAYCGQDVVATHAVYQNVLPKFFKTCPHPVSFGGVLQMGSSFLTVNEGWVDYIERCNKSYNDIANDVESKLLLLAENALERFEASPDFYKDDPWLNQLDWKKPPRVWKEGVLLARGNGYRKNQEPRWVTRAKVLPDKPEWYRQLWDSTDKRIRLTTRQRIAPLLLKLQWRGYPIVYSDNHGWTFRVPHEDTSYQTKAAALEFPKQGEKGYQPFVDTAKYRYYRLPHKFGEGVNVGNPLAKSYIPYFEDHTLSSFATGDDTSSKLARQALDMNAQCAYWVSARERIEEQFVVWDKEQGHSDRGLGRAQMGLPDGDDGGGRRSQGIILPQIVTMGTVTRRAVEKTWMTASNAKKNRIGSELKSNVEAPVGYKIVGADVDSEELWISSLMGDAQFRMHGATALGWMTLQGTKAAGTDLHSKTANILGISRDQAKIFNYGRIYGAGVQFATRLLQQFNPSIEAAEAKQKAVTLYAATKGVKEHKEADFALVTDRAFWHGGSESYMFNCLERTATAEDPRTPALGCGITDALKPKHTENQFMTSRVNWVVQSSGVDYLHMLLVSMNYLIRKYGIQARFMLCVHDEVRYMVKEEDTARATLALQISNLWTRALFSYKLGIHDLPQSVAFFSAVDIDHVFRKEVNMDCLTPTQKTPIPHGTSMTIEDVVQATGGGDLGPPVPGFIDAPTNAFPEELRSFEEKRRQELAAALAAEGLDEDARMAQGIYLEAQTLATLKDIKQMLKRREAEAAACRAKKAADEVVAATATGSGSDSGSGSGTGGELIPPKKTTTSSRTTTRRREKKSISYLNTIHARTGQWGMAADPNEILASDLAASQEDFGDAGEEEKGAKLGRSSCQVGGSGKGRSKTRAVSSRYYMDEQGRAVKKSGFGIRVEQEPSLPVRATGHGNNDDGDSNANNRTSKFIASATEKEADGMDSEGEPMITESFASAYDDDWTPPTEEWLKELQLELLENEHEHEYEYLSPLLTSTGSRMDLSENQALLSTLSKKANLPRSEVVLVSPQQQQDQGTRTATRSSSYSLMGGKGKKSPSSFGGYSIQELVENVPEMYDRRSSGGRS